MKNVAIVASLLASFRMSTAQPPPDRKSFRRARPIPGRPLDPGILVARRGRWTPAVAPPGGGAGTTAIGDRGALGSHRATPSPGRVRGRRDDGLSERCVRDHPAAVRAV